MCASAAMESFVHLVTNIVDTSLTKKAITVKHVVRNKELL